jgi:hypothetical protein
MADNDTEALGIPMIDALSCSSPSTELISVKRSLNNVVPLLFVFESIILYSDNHSFM